MSTPPSTDQSQTPRLLASAEAAHYLSITERHVRLLWTERRLPAIKVGRLLRFDRGDLDSFVERQRVDAVR